MTEKPYIAPPVAHVCAESIVDCPSSAPCNGTLFRCLVWTLLCTVCLWSCFSSANLLAVTNTDASARWVNAQMGTMGSSAQPVSAQQARAALEFLQENASKAQAAGSALPTLAFWRETQGQIVTENRTAAATVIAVLGDASLCLPAPITMGGLFSADDLSGCMVSEQLAWLLWGSTDVTGLCLTVDRQTYTVRGVFDGKQPVFLCATSADNTAGYAQSVRNPQGFYGFDIAGLPVADRRTALQTLLQAANLPAPAQICYPAARRALARALCAAPLALVTCFVLRRTWRLLWRRFPNGRCALIFAAAFCGALALPFLFAQIPAWLIPARWSDGAFWSALLNTIATEITNALALIPFTPDVLARKALLQAVVSCSAALWSVCALQRTHCLYAHDGS